MRNKKFKELSVKLAHQFWISYPPPGAGSSSSSKEKEKEKQQQTDEEKRSTSKEQRQLEYDAAVKVSYPLLHWCGLHFWSNSQTKHVLFSRLKLRH